MADTEFFLRNLWRWKIGQEELDYRKPTKETPTLDQLQETEWSAEFEKYMRNRLLMGYFRYGPLHRTDGKKYRRVEDAIRRLQQYLIEGNDELLVDAANLCLCEFEVGTHPLKHFNSVDDGEHAQSE